MNNCIYILPFLLILRLIKTPTLMIPFSICICLLLFRLFKTLSDSMCLQNYMSYFSCKIMRIKFTDFSFMVDWWTNGHGGPEETQVLYLCNNCLRKEKEEKNRTGKETWGEAGFFSLTPSVYHSCDLVEPPPLGHKGSLVVANFSLWHYSEC